ncbi:hypothetical protein [Lamprobacter modestohalophilus]|uniref:hypothetical protein n=1 Tax=Lamprobacter modestohalophilus TaxID=1064514 RepID=UPI001905BCA2|nr:hypothetical protein [Lamprobacter modestohalophilus]
MKKMREDPIVEEMRAVGKAFALEHGNDLGRICRALRERSEKSGRQVVNREPKRLEKKAAS